MNVVQQNQRMLFDSQQLLCLNKKSFLIFIVCIGLIDDQKSLQHPSLQLFRLLPQRVV